MQVKMKKNTLKFKTYKEEADFWDKQSDWTQFFDMSSNQAKAILISKDKEEIFTMRLPKFFTETTTCESLESPPMGFCPR